MRCKSTWFVFTGVEIFVNFFHARVNFFHEIITIKTVFSLVNKLYVSILKNTNVLLYHFFVLIQIFSVNNFHACVNFFHEIMAGLFFCQVKFLNRYLIGLMSNSH